MINQFVLKRAIDGEVENQYIIAQRYYYGIGGEKNLAVAESWYLEAAKRGHVASMFMYAYMLLTGENGKLNVETGTKYLKKACAKNYLNAILMLARNYYYGFGVKRSEKMAYKLWERGAKRGSAEAEYYLGLCYSKGIYVKPNVLKSKKHLLNALSNGFSMAQDAISDLRYAF